MMSNTFSNSQVTHQFLDALDWCRIRWNSRFHGIRQNTVQNGVTTCARELQNTQNPKAAYLVVFLMFICHFGKINAASQSLF